MFALTAFGALLLVALFAFAIPLIIGIVVYRDADKRVDCNPWLWALIAALAPSLVGVIIYLIVRSDYPLKPETMSYDEFGNPVTQKPAGFPKWLKVLLIVFVVLFAILLLGGCAAAIIGMVTFEPNSIDSFYYSF